MEKSSQSSSAGDNQQILCGPCRQPVPQTPSHYASRLPEVGPEASARAAEGLGPDTGPDLGSAGGWEVLVCIIVRFQSLFKIPIKRIHVHTEIIR